MNKYMSFHNSTTTVGGDDDFEERLQEEVERLWRHAKDMEAATDSKGEETEDPAADPEDYPNMPDLVDVNGQVAPDQRAEEDRKYPEDEVTRGRCVCAPVYEY